MFAELFAAGDTVVSGDNQNSKRTINSRRVVHLTSFPMIDTYEYRLCCGVDRQKSSLHPRFAVELPKLNERRPDGGESEEGSEGGVGSSR